MQSSALIPIKIGNRSHEVKNQYWLFTICMLAFIPTAQGLMTLTYTGQLSGQQIIIRLFSLVTISCEIILLLLAERSGISYLNILKSFSKTIRSSIAAWLFFAMVAYAIKPDYPIISGFVLVRYILQGLSFCALIHLVSVSKSYDDQKWFTVLNWGGATYFILISVFALTVPDPKTFLWESSMPSATSIRHIGNYLAILAIAPTTLLIASTQGRLWLYALCLTCLTMSIAWTGSRAAWLGLLVAIITGCFFIRSTISKARVKLLVGSFFFGTAISTLLPNPTSNFGIIRFWSSIQPGIDTSSGRIEVWTNTFTEIVKHPLLGHGAGRFANNMNNIYNYDVDNPHNFVLQYFYDWGLFGGCAGLFLLAHLGYSIFLRRDKTPIVVFSAMSGFSILVFVGLLEGMLYHPMKMMLVTLMIVPIFRAPTREI